MNDAGRKNMNSQYIMKKYKCLDEDGLAKVGASIQSGDIYINKKVPVVSQEVKDKLKVIGLGNDEVSWND
jgi:DNA-directed RNA polymerase beta subunit